MKSFTFENDNTRVQQRLGLLYLEGTNILYSGKNIEMLDTFEGYPVRIVGNFFEGRPHGLWLTYDCNDLLIMKMNFSYGLLNGIIESFDPENNGNKFIEGRYKNDKKEGYWRHFNDNGVIEKVEHWIEGELVN